VVPDVATVGDPTTGFLVGGTQAFPGGAPRYAECRIGGTSLSCPVFAAIMALADQAKGIHHGCANPLLYSLAGSAAFRDIVDPPSPMAAVRTDWANFLNPHQGQLFTLRPLNQTGTLHTTPGYGTSRPFGTDRRSWTRSGDAERRTIASGPIHPRVASFARTRTLRADGA
jgi:hypothetical protein